MAFSGVLPKVVYDVGPGGALTTDQNAILQNRILGGQAQYATPQAQANAYLTAQQGAWYPWSQMNNPMMWQVAMGNPALQATLNNAMSQLPVPKSGAGGWPLPSPPPSNGFLPQLMGKLSNVFGLGQNDQNAQPQQTNALNQPPSAMTRSQVDGSNFNPANRGQGYVPVSNTQVPATQPNGPQNDVINTIPRTQNNQVAQPAQQLAVQPANVAAPERNPNNQAPISTPVATPAGRFAGGDYSQMITSPELQKSIAAMNTANMSAENKQAAQEAQESINLGNMFKAYDEIWKLSKNNTTAKGPILGQLDPSGPTAGVLDGLGIIDLSPAQMLNKLGAQIQTETGKGIFQRFAGPEIGLMRSQKLDPTMKDPVEDSLINQGLSGLGRGAEKLPFYMSLDAPPLNASPQEKQLLYTNYSKSYPPYESVNGQIVSNPSSINGHPLWEYWTTVPALNAIRRGDTNWQPPGWDNIVKIAKQQGQQNRVANLPPPTDDDISFTAKKYNMKPEDVKSKLGLK